MTHACRATDQPLACSQDVVAYRAVGVHPAKIFIINPKGEITHMNSSYTKS